MITSRDLIPLAYTSELPLAGALYACRRLFTASEHHQAARDPAMRLAAGQAVIELALQRYLTENGIPFGQDVVAPFTSPSHASLVVGRRLCQVIAIVNLHPLNTGQTLDQAYSKANRLPAPSEGGLPDAHENEEFLIYADITPAGPRKVAKCRAGIVSPPFTGGLGPAHPLVRPGGVESALGIDHTGRSMAGRAK